MIEHKTIAEVIVSLNQRISRMESGAKPMVKLSTENLDSFSVQSADGTDRENVIKTYQFAWPSSSVEANPVAVPYVSFSFTGGDARLENVWQPEDLLSADSSKSYVKVWVKNLTVEPGGSTANVTVKVRWVYLAMSSASI